MSAFKSYSVAVIMSENRKFEPETRSRKYNKSMSSSSRRKQTDKIANDLIVGISRSIILLLLFNSWQIISGYLKTSNSFKYSLNDKLQGFKLTPVSTLMSPYDRYLSNPSDFDNPSNFFNVTNISHFHRSLLEKYIVDYMEFHKEHRKLKSSRLLIFRPVSTGIGDRFERLIFVYFAAVISNRIFVIDWQRPFPIENFVTSAQHGSNLFFDHHSDNFHGSKYNEIVLDKDLHNSTFFRSVILSAERNVVMTMINRPDRSTLESLAERKFGKCGGQNEWTLFIGNHLCRRAVLHHVVKINHDYAVQFLKYALHMNLLDDIILPTYKTQAIGDIGLAQNQEEEFTFRSIPTNYISVHARLGVGVGENNDPRFGSMVNSPEIPIKCLANRAVRLAFGMPKQARRIFFATDSPSIRQLFVESVAEQGNGRLKVVHGNWDAFHTNHIDRGRGLKDSRTQGRENKWKAIRGVYMDLLAVGKARHIVAMKSTFPLLAFNIGTAETLTLLHVDNCSSSPN